MAFLQPPSARQPIFRAPPVVLWLIAGLAAAHAARVLQPIARANALVFQYGLVPAPYSPAYLQSRIANAGSVWDQALPFVSYMAVHGDWTHLTINCLWLLAFGPVVARRFGASLFLGFFVVCGVAAAVTYIAFNWGSESPVVGASGAISGLMAAAIRMRPGPAPLVSLWSRPVLMFTLVWSVINLVTGVTGLGMVTQGVAVAWQAHLGGFLAGLLLVGPFDALGRWLRAPSKDR